MGPERSRELRNYLQKILKLSSDLPDPAEHHEFEYKLYSQLKSYHEKMRDTLKSAFPDEDNEDLRLLVEKELQEDLSNIFKGNRTYTDKLLSLVEKMDVKGSLLELIAAVHKRNPRNTTLNMFIQGSLKPIIQSLMPAQHMPQPEAIPQPEFVPLTPASPDATNGEGHHHGSPKSKGIMGSDIFVASVSASVLPARETKPERTQEQPTPFPHKPVSTDHQLSEDLVTQAYKRTRGARKIMEKVYAMFQNGGKVSDPGVIDSINEAEELIKDLSNIFFNTPIPDYLELDCRLTTEEKYSKDILSLIRLYCLRDANVKYSVIDFQKAEREFNRLFSSLKDLDSHINLYQQQIQKSSQSDIPLSGSGA